MPHIFKNMRRKLASENKTAAYLRYALGEILLVVIGILIALQVNNWNENRILQNNIVQYTNSLKADLAQDTLNISNLLKGLEADTTKLGNFRNRMSSPGVTKDTLVHIAQYEYKPHIYGEISFNDNTITSLRATGNFADLEKWLRSDLLVLNSLHQYYLTRMDIDARSYVEQALFYTQHYPFNDKGHIRPGSKLSMDIWKASNFTELGASLNALIGIKYSTEQWAGTMLNEIQGKTKEILRKLNSETRR